MVSLFIEPFYEKFSAIEHDTILVNGVLTWNILGLQVLCGLRSNLWYIAVFHLYVCHFSHVWALSIILLIFASTAWVWFALTFICITHCHVLSCIARGVVLILVVFVLIFWVNKLVLTMFIWLRLSFSVLFYQRTTNFQWIYRLIYPWMSTNLFYCRTLFGIHRKHSNNKIFVFIWEIFSACFLPVCF